MAVAVPITKQPERPFRYRYCEPCALVLLSLSGGGLCVSSSAAVVSTSSDINSRDGEINATDETPLTAVSISRDEKISLLLRIKLQPKAKKVTYKCDTCDKEFSSPQAFGRHKTSHRHKPITTVIPDLNVPARVFECSICGQVYDSGAALGGHKRKHYSSKSR